VLSAYKNILLDNQSKTIDSEQIAKYESELKKVDELLKHKADLKFENGTVEYVLKYQGGHFYRITSNMFFFLRNPSLAPEEAEFFNKAMYMSSKCGIPYPVIPSHGPNKGLIVAEGIGRRELLRDKTHLVFSLVSGLPIGVSSEAMRAASSSDAQRLQELLDTPPDGVVLSDVTGKIDEVAVAVNTLLKKRKYSELAARRVTRNPEFRRSVDYPLFWTGLLDTKPEPNNTSEEPKAIAFNSSILSTLSDLVVNLPVVDAGDFDKIEEIKKLTHGDFVEPASDNHGLFRIKPEAVKRISGLT